MSAKSFAVIPLFPGESDSGETPVDPTKPRKTPVVVVQECRADPLRAVHAAAFDAFAKLALAYFEAPTDELRTACEAAALVVTTLRKVG